MEEGQEKQILTHKTGLYTVYSSPAAALIRHYLLFHKKTDTNLALARYDLRFQTVIITESLLEISFRLQKLDTFQREFRIIIFHLIIIGRVHFGIQ